MAFVSQSPRKTLAPINSASQNLGPGEYTSDLNLLSKSNSIQRKQPAFGFGEERKLGKTNDTNQMTPGPGAYISHNELASAAYDKNLDDHTSYIVKDNGHINQRTQQYAFQTSRTRESSLQVLSKHDTPGPGSYQINTSSFGTTNHTNTNHIIKPYVQGLARKKNSITDNLSPKIGISGYLNLSIPSIPSRYMQPNLDVDESELLQIQQEGMPILNHLDNTLTTGKVKIVTNDKARLGPGSYQVSESLIKKSPRSNVYFGISKTMRTVDDRFINKMTNNTVGPGSYEITKELDRKIYNPTIPRDGVNYSAFSQSKPKKNRNNGSIRDNFEVDSDSDEDEQQKKRQKQLSPGPGQYLKETHINQLGKDSQRPQQFQFFGSSIERFKPPISCTNGIGPGAYNTQQAGAQDRNKHFQFAGSASFMGISRSKNNLMVNKTRLEIPGPGDYKVEDSLQYIKDTKDQGKQAFQSNIDRFKVRDEAVPGPGKYPLPSSMNIRSSSQIHASFRSGVKKELVFPMDMNVPGTAVYNPQDFKQIGVQKISGGAPNNFSLLAKKQLNNTLSVYHLPEKEILNVSPRGIINDISTPAAVGPGYYGGSKFKILDGQPKLIQDSKMSWCLQ